MNEFAGSLARILILRLTVSRRYCLLYLARCRGRRCILCSPPVSDGQTTHYTPRRPLRAFPRERATQAGSRSAPIGERRCPDHPSVRRVSHGRVNRRAPGNVRDSATTGRKDDAGSARTNERTRGETQLETRRGPTDELSIAPTA